jgi:hypothetical protein
MDQGNGIQTSNYVARITHTLEHNFDWLGKRV